MKSFMFGAMMLGAIALVPVSFAQEKKDVVTDAQVKQQFDGVKTGVDVFRNKLVLYIPNRLIDLMDVFSVELRMGATAEASLRCTRAFGFGVGVGPYGALIKDINRQYGWAVTEGWFAHSFGMEAEDLERLFAGGTVQPYWRDGSNYPAFSDSIYDCRTGARDYWAIEASAACGLGVRGAIHPVEIFDFLCGIIFLDPKNDDIKQLNPYNG